jgi:hypothetical protein
LSSFFVFTEDGSKDEPKRIINYVILNIVYYYLLRTIYHAYSYLPFYSFYYQELIDLSDYLDFKITLPCNIQCEYVLDTWVQVNGITYYKDMAVAMYMNDNTIVFGKIHYITINNMRQISFICTEFYVQTLNRHYCAPRGVGEDPSPYFGGG